MRFTMVIDLDEARRFGPEGTGFTLPPPIDAEPWSWEVALSAYSVSLKAPLPSHTPISILLSVISPTSFLADVDGFRPVVGSIFSKQSKGRLATHLSDPKYFPMIYSGPLYVTVSPIYPEKGWIELDFRRRNSSH